SSPMKRQFLINIQILPRQAEPKRTWLGHDSILAIRLVETASQRGLPKSASVGNGTSRRFAMRRKSSPAEKTSEFMDS
ncbi:MAG TPA: hypothetical protein PLY87_15095, partial [Planctomycetaceae bacterium]|nr:hypothetical protein [Planctomycetaceae bacterium]